MEARFNVWMINLIAFIYEVWSHHLVAKFRFNRVKHALTELGELFI